MKGKLYAKKYHIWLNLVKICQNVNLVNKIKDKH